MTELLAEVVRRAAKTRPDAPAVSGGGRRVTYTQLDSNSNRIAHALAAAGARAGSRIGYLTKASAAAVELLIACAKAGMVAVPLNWRLSEPELVAVAKDAELTALLTEPAFRSSATAITAALDGLPVFGLDTPSWYEAQPDIDPGLGADRNAVLLQIYTSGTTGVPKGVQLTAGCVAYGDELMTAERMDQESVAINVLPMFHIAGQGWIITSLLAGAHMIMMPDFVPAEVVAVMEAERVTNGLFVPAMLQVLTSLPGIEDRDFSSLRTVLYGASPITPSLLRRSLQVFGCGFTQLYGMTETAAVTTRLLPEDHDPGGPREYLLRSAGTALPGVGLRIVDVDSGEVLGAGEVGEIQVRSAHLTIGYWKRPEESDALFTDDGWLRTGDAGYLDEHGYLFISDRIKDMVITGGENVYPVEVEAVLAEHPAVAEVAVIGTPDPKWGEAVTAVVVVKPGMAQPTADELVAFTAGRLASYKKPRVVRFTDSLPRNASGKVLKRELRATI